MHPDILQQGHFRQAAGLDAGRANMKGAQQAEAEQGSQA